MVAFWAIGAGAGVVIAAMIATGTLQITIAMLVLVADAVNACAQAAKRFRADVTAQSMPPFFLVSTG
jgi:hypothetical protein